MNDKLAGNFESAVDECLLRHRSILDVMTKFQEASSRVNRALAKAATECGCISVNATRQRIPADAEYSQLRNYMSSHISGQLCDHCKEVLTRELGHALFYITAICRLTDLPLEKMLEQELRNLNTLGVFHLS